MKMKQIYSIALAGALTLGVALGSGTSAYAAQGDWIRSGVDSEGNEQPSTKYVPYNPPYATWYEISYGYTVQPGYKYMLRLPYDGTGYKDDGVGDGYGYQSLSYSSREDRIEVFSVNVSQYNKSTIEEDFQNIPDYYVLPSDKEIVIRVDSDDINDITRVLTTGYIMVYDQNNNLVDGFDLSSQPVTVTTPADTTVPAETTPADTTVPAETTPADTTVPAETTPADTTVPAETVPAEEPVLTPAPETPAPATDIQPTAPASSDAVVDVAKEVIRGKWGVGKERRIRLEQAGYDYKEVQKKVYELMK